MFKNGKLKVSPPVRAWNNVRRDTRGLPTLPKKTKKQQKPNNRKSPVTLWCDVKPSKKCTLIRTCLKKLYVVYSKGHWFSILPLNWLELVYMQGVLYPTYHTVQTVLSTVARLSTAVQIGLHYSMYMCQKKCIFQHLKPTCTQYVADKYSKRRSETKREKNITINQSC
jgi:hypothetical protein